MDGEPVWLASVSYQPDGVVVPTGRWGKGARRGAERHAERLLREVGDSSREVLFRMNLTLCRHRALSAEEKAGLPRGFKNFKATDTAGCSVETIWRKGTSSPASLPCENPGRIPIPGADDPDLWLPEPCGRCESCVARAAVAGGECHGPSV